jgi:hypothetical protein
MEFGLRVQSRSGRAIGRRKAWALFALYSPIMRGYCQSSKCICHGARLAYIHENNGLPFGINLADLPLEIPQWRFCLSFAMMILMFHGPSSQLHDFVIRCKRCRENIAAPVETMPDTWIIHTCPLCGERRRYLPAEIFRGRLSHQFEKLGTRRGA